MKKLVRVLISLLYIFWGLYSPISAFRAIVALDGGAIASAAVGLIMLSAGICGLIGIKKGKCRIFGIVIFVLAILAVVLALPAISWRAIVSAILAWLFIACL